METLTLNVGLEQEYKTDIASKLNVLLADYQAYYMNLRGMHWNIKGKNFFMMHEKFEELYNEANVVVDEIAERILTLGAEPLHTMEDYLEFKTIKTIKGVSEGEYGVKMVQENLSALLGHERQILAIASDNEDEGTTSLMSDLITGQEKLIWMLNAFLS